MSGALVGDSSPKAQLILDQSGSWELLIHLNKAFAAQSVDKEYVYTILVPKNVGCNFNLYNSMSNNGATTTISDNDNDSIIKDTGSSFVAVESDQVHAVLDLQTSTDTVGCFQEYILTINVADGFNACNMTVCLTGTLFVDCGQKTEGCDKFPVYINLTTDGEDISDDYFTTGLDNGNK